MTKLHALDEHPLDYTSLLRIARAVREQVDWPARRERCTRRPYALPFFTLVEALAIVPATATPSPVAAHVRVISNGG